MKQNNQQSKQKKIKNSLSQLLNARINKIIEISKYDFVFVTNKDRQSIVFSLNNLDPFIDVINTSSLPNFSLNKSTFFHFLRRTFTNSIIKEIQFFEKKAIIKITLLVANQNYTYSNYHLYLEMIKAHPNFIVVNEDNMIVDCLYKNKNILGERLIFQGKEYLFNSDKYDIAPILSKNESFSQEYFESNKNYLMRNNSLPLYKFLENSVKKTKEKILKQESELEKASSFNELILMGNLLLTNNPPINNDVLVLDDITINVDKSLSAIENANLLFKKAKKFKRTSLILNQQVELSRQSLNYYQTIYSQLSSCNGDELEEIAQELHISKPENKPKKNTISAYKPYYLLFKGIKIGFGKNNFQNEYLTHKLANKNDLFLHIKNYSGSHVVIFAQDISDEIINFATDFVLYLANKNDGEITIAKIKDVKKGRFPGQVILNKEKVIYKRLSKYFFINANDIKR